MRAFASLAQAILRWSAAIRFRWGRTAREAPVRTVHGHGYRVDVLPSMAPPLPDLLPPDPDFIGRTLAKAVGDRGAAVSLVVGGYGVRESLYLVTVGARPSPGDAVPKTDTLRI